MKLRPYQQKIVNDIYLKWSTLRNVIAVLPTGGGKTVIFSHILSRHGGPSCAIAHRQELVCQISMALCRHGVKHKILAPANIIKEIVKLHYQELNRSFFDPNAQCTVAGIDTLVKRAPKLTKWFNSVSLWIIDECHHITKENKWGVAVKLFSQAKGLGVTATPVRADGQGLGRHADGVMDTMILGGHMRELIEQKWLSEYRIFCPPSDLKFEEIPISKTTGDYNNVQLRAASHRSRIVGDVVSHYLRIARGKLGITFTVDIETAHDIAKQFNEAGVRAAVITAKTPIGERAKILRDFRKKLTLQLVNVDIFGEGFDLPAIEVVSMARPTHSYGLYYQQFGRALRMTPDKSNAIIIDHVGNVLRHGLPDIPRGWSLDRRERRSKTEQIQMLKVCPECTAAYARELPACPYCGFRSVPQSRASIETIDGDLLELDAETLSRMRRAVDIIDGVARIPQGLNSLAAGGCAKQHRLRQEAQQDLRNAISWWAGYQRQKGLSESRSYRRFYITFGTDVLSAQALGRRDAEDLTNRINLDILTGLQL